MLTYHPLLSGTGKVQVGYLQLPVIFIGQNLKKTGHTFLLAQVGEVVQMSFHSGPLMLACSMKCKPSCFQCCWYTNIRETRKVFLGIRIPIHLITSNHGFSIPFHLYIHEHDLELASGALTCGVIIYTYTSDMANLSFNIPFQLYIHDHDSK